MKVLVIGKQGQVATCLGIQANTNPELDLIFASRPNLDLAKPETIRSVLSETKPDIVINAAAYTLVDQAEDDKELAYAINGIAPGVLAEAAKENGAKIIHISTDYVFDGQQDRPYIETDLVAPLGVYGLSKLAGEKAVRAATDDYIILRTAWVYSPFGRNFLKTMLALAETREDISVVERSIWESHIGICYRGWAVSHSEEMGNWSPIIRMGKSTIWQEIRKQVGPVSPSVFST